MGLADGQAWEAEHGVPEKKDPEKAELERRIGNLRKQLDEARRELRMKERRIHPGRLGRIN